MKKIITAVLTAIFAVPTYANAADYTIQDMKGLNNFLLTGSSSGLLKSLYDLNGDNVVDVFDLCLMRQNFLDQHNKKNDTLVAYFSRTGNTEKIADHIINVTNADRYEINAAIPYTDADIRYQDNSCRANKEQNDKSARPEIADPIEDIAVYDIIFLGYPIWWGEEPRIIDTFLESYDFSGKTVIPFCTSGSSGISGSEKNISSLTEIGNQLSGKRFSSDATEKDVSDWIDTLNLPEIKEETKLNIEVNGKTLSATLENNSSADALVKLIGNKPLSISLDDYAGFEKTGNLPEALPTNDKKTDTDYGDIILYQGNKFVIYYDKNSWSFTKLGHIDNITQDELKEILGTESVEVTVMLYAKCKSTARKM